VNLETLANMADVASAAAVIGGIVFGLIQLSEYRKQRRGAAAAELMRTFYSADLANAVTVIRSLPDGIPATDLRQRGQDVEKAAVLISTTFETMGLLAFERIAPFELVERLTGGIVVVMWRKLGPWLACVRQEQSQPSWAEWFEWLALQCAQHKHAVQPAYERYRDWKA
jgi:hypothetical protein